MQSRKQIRSHIRSLRKSLTKQQQHTASQQLITQLTATDLIKPYQNIALYLANDGELNPDKLIEYCWQQQANVYLPVLHPFSKGHLLFLYYSPTTELTYNQYGIAEPKLECTAVLPVSQLDLVFTPLVAFDELGNRLGMGGGYYDRTFANYWQQSKPTQIGLAHTCQQIDLLPTATWDIPMQMIATPDNVFDFR